MRRDHAELKAKLTRAVETEHAAARSAGSPEVSEAAEAAHLELERVLATLTSSTRESLRAPDPLPRRKLG